MVRQWKRRQAVATKPEDERKAKAYVDRWQRKLRELTGETGLPRQYRREGGRVKLSEAAKRLGPARLTDGKNNGMMLADTGKHSIRITQNSIDSVPQFTEFSTTEANEAVRKACVEILTDLINDKVKTEEAITLPVSKLSDYVSGKFELKGLKQKGGKGKGSVIPKDINEPYIALHNHWSSETFSFLDVAWLGGHSNCMGIVVIGNDGRSAYTLIKDRSFDLFIFLDYRSRIEEGKERFKVNDKYMKGLKVYGFTYTTRND